MIKQITRDELVKMMDSSQKFRLVDVLEADSYEKVHIKGAVSIPLDELEKKAPELLKKDETIITYCASFDCQASTQAAEKLVSLGYQNVLDYKGGLKDYKEANLPLAGRFHEKKACISSCCSSC